MDKPLYIEPLYSGHFSTADTFFENQWSPLLRGFTVFYVYMLSRSRISFQRNSVAVKTPSLEDVMSDLKLLEDLTNESAKKL